MEWSFHKTMKSFGSNLWCCRNVTAPTIRVNFLNPRGQTRWFCSRETMMTIQSFDLLAGPWINKSKGEVHWKIWSKQDSLNSSVPGYTVDALNSIEENSEAGIDTFAISPPPTINRKDAKLAKHNTNRSEMIEWFCFTFHSLPCNKTINKIQKFATN